MRTNTLTVGLLAALSGPASAYIRFDCANNIIEERADPVVNSGVISGHVHKIAGGNGFDLAMDFQKARASTCSSCPIKQDLSNYWTPKLYFKSKEGKFISVPMGGEKIDSPNGGMTVYYQQRGPNTKALKAFPPGFRMLAGDPSLRSFGGGFAADAVRYACIGAGQPETNNLPNYDCPDGLRAQIYFPSCWDGSNLDSLDHRSHMAYPKSGNFDNGPCPDTHPVQLVSLFYEVLYATHQFKNQWYGNEQPFVLSNGDTTGYSFHGDFVNGWDVNTLQQIINTCTNDAAFGSIEKKDCPPIDKFTNEEMNTCKANYKGHFNEKVYGTLDVLPGNNPVSIGPGPVENPPADAVVEKGTGTGASSTAGSPTSVPAAGTATAKSPSEVSAPDYPSHSSNVPAAPAASSSGSSGSGSSEYGSGGGSESSSGSSKPGSSSSGSGSGSSELGSGSGSSHLGSSSGYSHSGPGSSGSGSSGSSSSSSSSAVSASVATVAGFKYVGCAKDNHVRTIDDKNTIYTNVGDKMTAQLCANFCKGFTYFGLEWSSQCFCGNSLPSDRAPNGDESACSSTCKGDSSQICGGGWALSLYQSTTASNVALNSTASPAYRAKRHGFQHRRKMMLGGKH